MRLLSLFLAIPLFALPLRAQESDLCARADSLLNAGQYADAIPLCDRALAADSRNERCLRTRGYSYLQLGTYDRAQSDYQAAVAVNPECVNCYINLASIALIRDSNQQALALANKAIGLDSKSIDAYLLRARVRAQMRNEADALLDFNRAAQIDPARPEPHVRKALFYSDIGRSDYALESMNRAVQLAPSTASLYFQRAFIYISMKMWDSALADMGRSIDHGGGTALLYANRAGLYMELGRIESAQADLDMSIKLDSTLPLARTSRAAIRHMKEDMDGECEDYRAALALMIRQNPSDSVIPLVRTSIANFCDSSNASYYYQRGIAAYNLGNFQRAVEFYNAGLKRFKGSPMLIMFRGNAQLALGNYQKAIDDYQLALGDLDKLISEQSTHPNYSGMSRATLRAEAKAEMNMSISTALLGLGRNDAAVSAIDLAVDEAENATRPHYGRVLGRRGAVLAEIGRYTDALKDLDRARELAPDDADVLVNWAALQVVLSQTGAVRREVLTFGVQGRGGSLQSGSIPISEREVFGRTSLKEAIAACDRAITINPNNARAYYIRGVARQQTNHGDGCDDFRQAQKLGLPDMDRVIGAECR